VRLLIFHNDFPVYWKGRLLYLKPFLEKHNIDFHALELFGKGSPYVFDSSEGNKEAWWSCLFPDKAYSDLPKDEIRSAVTAKLDEINPDIIIGGSIVFVAGAQGLRWAKQHGRKFVMFDDAKPYQIRRNFIVNTIKNLLIRQADAFWLPSPEYDQTYTMLNRKKAFFFHGYNTINNALFKPAGEKKFGSKKLISVARLVPLKNYINLLQAWKQVQQHAPGYRLQIIGDGPEREKLTVLANSIQLNTVDFLGTVNNADIPGYFHEAEAFVLPSLWESWGLVVNEAMAAGLPILLSNNINASKALLKEEENGYSFEATSVADITQKLLRFIHLSVDQKAAMSAASLTIIDQMSFATMGDQLLSALPQIADRKTKKPGLIARAIISKWDGRYNTAAWDKMNA